MIGGTGQAKQNRTGKTEQDRQNRTGQAKQNGQNKTWTMYMLHGHAPEISSMEKQH